MEEPLTVCYITSLGRSGSTLLDLLISAHPDVFSVGEVINIRRYAHMTKTKSEVSRFGNECTCGAATVWECPFWTAVEERMQQDWGVSLRDLDLQTKEPVDPGKRNLALFESVAAVSGKRVIVDSSKAPWRLSQLLGVDGLRVVPLHLVRSARGTANSRKKLGRSVLSSAVLFLLRSMVIRRVVRRTDHLFVRYDDVVSETAETLEMVMSKLGLSYDPVQLRWAGLERHNIGGNPMRRSTDSTIRLDDSWKTGLTAWQRFVVDTVTLPTRFMFPS